MSFLQKIKSFAKSNWTFVALVILPILRFLWRAFIGKSGEKAYKRGDVIDVEVKK